MPILRDITVVEPQETGVCDNVFIRTLINPELQSKYIDKLITVQGWTKTVRKQAKGRVFVDMVDGSSVKALQVFVDSTGLEPAVSDALMKCGTSCSIRVTGRVVRHYKFDDIVELHVDGKDGTSLEVVALVEQSSYPLQPKEHSREFLRSLLNLRPRTALFTAIFRIRSELAYATHQFFRIHGFYYIHAPIITAADCEGAGEMFQVTTLIPESGKLADIPKDSVGKIDYKKDFFGEKVGLTVSGQLAVENFALSMSNVYTFGPTFRAEDSHTSRHLSEFWMIEPEIAYADLEINMRVAEAYLKFCVEFILKHCAGEIEYLQTQTEPDLRARLEQIIKNDFARVSYTEAIEILKNIKDVEFDPKPEWGEDLGSQMERYLTEVVYKRPTIVYDFPASLKAFYMKQNPDGKTVAAMDILLPGIGEVIGGSQREDDTQLLLEMMEKKQIDKKELAWYVDLRRFGSVPHSGFGLGFERLIMLCTGVNNIRDVIPFPRYPKNCKF